MSASIVISLAAAIGAAGAVSATQNALRDVQVGEEGRLMRIALLCEKPCAVEAAEPASYRIAGVEADLEIPLQGRSALVSALRIEPETGGARLSLVTDRALKSFTVNPCVVRGLGATCLDLEFAPYGVAVPAAAEAAAPEATAPASDPAQADDAHVENPAGGIYRDDFMAAAADAADAADAPEAAAAALPAPAPEPARAAGADQRSAPDAPPEASPGAAREPLPARPALREAPNRDVLTFASLARPEDEPLPTLAALKPLDPAPATAPSVAPSVRAGRRLAPPAAFDLAATAEMILARRLGAGECQAAQTRLDEDAWALDAMVDVGFCRAMNGDLQEADALFARLLDYTPDNYEALVGRALIAARAGREDAAREFFQDALDALPPIEESDRIVAAMKAL